MKDWTLWPQDSNENAPVLLYYKFWKQDVESEKVASIPVYADLLLTDDPRCLEAATMIFDKLLKGTVIEKTAHPLYQDRTFFTG
jgi:hypothetical protein